MTWESICAHLEIASQSGKKYPAASDLLLNGYLLEKSKNLQSGLTFTGPLKTCCWSFSRTAWWFLHTIGPGFGFSTCSPRYYSPVQYLLVLSVRIMVTHIIIRTRGIMSICPRSSGTGPSCVENAHDHVLSFNCLFRAHQKGISDQHGPCLRRQDRGMQCVHFESTCTPTFHARGIASSALSLNCFSTTN